MGDNVWLLTQSVVSSSVASELSCSVEMPGLITIPIEVTQETRADSMGTGNNGDTTHKYLQ